MENKIKYKLFFSDLDHTLVVDDHIPTFNLEAINQAKEKGSKICDLYRKTLQFYEPFIKRVKY